MKTSRLVLVGLLALPFGCAGSAGTPSLAPELEALLRGFVPLTANDLAVTVANTTVVGLRGVAVTHWDATVPAKVPPFSDTEIRSHGIFNVDLDTTDLQTFMSLYPLGKDDETNPTIQVLAANLPLAMNPGNYHFVHLRVETALAINVADPTLLYEYGFVFDEDGSVSTGYNATEPTKFFNGSDRWYELTYSNAQGWNFMVYTASTTGTGESEVSTITEVSSGAKIIMSGDTLVLMVPANEFTSPMPEYRTTSFVHDGDFGIPSPHSWSGNAEPRVVEGMQRYP